LETERPIKSLLSFLSALLLALGESADRCGSVRGFERIFAGIERDKPK
jgi:hypothetical protein